MPRGAVSNSAKPSPLSPAPNSSLGEQRIAMPRAPVSWLLSLSRRGYAGSAGADVQQHAPAAAAMAARISGAEGGSTAASSKEIFWMRDPKTGNWIPENRFADVDAAELRAQLLARKC